MKSHHRLTPPKNGNHLLFTMVEKRDVDESAQPARLLEDINYDLLMNDARRPPACSSGSQERGDAVGGKGRLNKPASQDV